MNKELPTLIFDPKCSLCLRIKALIQTIDLKKRIRLVSLYDPTLFERFNNLSFDECYGKVHYIDEQENVWVGADAVEEILKRLAPHPLTKKLVETKLSRLAFGVAYDFINAYRLKKSPPCDMCRP